MGILDLLRRTRAAPGKSSLGDTDTVRKVVAELDAVAPERARHLAALGYLLGRVAFDAGDHRNAIGNFRSALSCPEVHTASAEGFAVLTDFYLAKALEAEGYLTAALHEYEAYERRAAPLAESAAGIERPGQGIIRPPALATLLRLNRGSAAGPISAIHVAVSQG